MGLKDDITDLISRGETGQAIEVLLRATKGWSADLHAQAVLISGRYEQWRKEQRTGMTADETERNRINAALLELAELSERGNLPARRPPFSLARMAGIILVLIAVLVGGWTLYSSLFKGQPTGSKTTADQEVPSQHAARTKPGELRAEMDNWQVRLQPFGAPCLMLISSLTLEAKDPATNFLHLTLSAKNIGEGWYPVQLTNDLFLLESGGHALQNEKDLSVVEIGPGEAKTVELLFSTPAAAREWSLLVREDGGGQVRVQIGLVND